MSGAVNVKIWSHDQAIKSAWLRAGSLAQATTNRSGANSRAVSRSSEGFMGKRAGDSSAGG